MGVPEEEKQKAQVDVVRKAAQHVCLLEKIMIFLFNRKKKRQNSQPVSQMKINLKHHTDPCPALTSVFHELVELLQKVLPLLGERLHLLLQTGNKTVWHLSF